MAEKFKLTTGKRDFTKAEFIRNLIDRLDDEEINKRDFRMVEFEWRTMDVMRDAHPKPLTQDEILEAIELKFEKVN